MFWSPTLKAFPNEMNSLAQYAYAKNDQSSTSDG